MLDSSASLIYKENSTNTTERVKNMCNCGKSGGAPAESYVVTRANGQTEEFSSKVAADIAVTKSGGTITVKKK
jgi:hypothetical protein